MDREGEGAEAGIGADVRGRLFAADVLLAGRKRQHEALPPVGVHGPAAQPARRLAHIFVAGGEQAEIGPAEIQAVADRLALADHDVGAHGAGRFDQAERENFGHDRDQQHALGAAGVRQGSKIAQIAEEIRVLHHDAGQAAIQGADQVFRPARIGRRERDLLVGHAQQGARGFGVMRMQAARQQGLAAPRHAMRHQDRFGGRGRAVVHRGVGDLHAGQIGDLGLEFEQDLERSLRDFRLVGRVRGEEFRTLNQMVHRRRHVMLVGAGADEEGNRARRDIFRRQRRKLALDFQLGAAQGQVERPGQQGVARRVGVERVDGGDADARQHVVALLEAERKIAHSDVLLLEIGFEHFVERIGGNFARFLVAVDEEGRRGVDTEFLRGFGRAPGRSC